MIDRVGLLVRLGFVLVAVTSFAVAGDEPPVAFDREIAPLLVRRCLDCHSGTEKKGMLDLSRAESATKGGESGAAIVPGKSADSLLWQRVRDGEMPPKKPLLKEETELLRRWIDGGAKWGASPIDPFAFTTNARAGYDWWSLQPVKRPPVPEVRSSKSETRNPIDAFVWTRLQKESLVPSPSADKRTLIRRLSFDLIGLPPTPAEFAEFEKDDSPKAYEKLVDRLLDSPHYGERWARHWLDIIRFGESQGFERDKLRMNSWRYRDWVVSAFNRDLPYDEFVRLQLAGDVLRPDDPEAIIATGFLVAGAYDEVGQSQQSAAMRAVVRQDEMEDYVSTIGETFLGLTVHCARCHDHKFDPILARDYYRMSAVLAGVRPGDREIPAGNEGWRASQQKIVAHMNRELDSLTARLKELEADTRKTILTERRTRIDKKVPPQPIARWEFNDDLKDSIGELHVTANGAKLKDGSLLVNGRQAFAATEPLKKPIKEKTLEVWLRLEHRNQTGGGAITLQTLDGQTFDSIVFAEREPNRWMAGSDGFVRTQSFQAPEETEADNQVVHLAIVYHADGTITGYRNGQSYGQPYKSSGTITFEAEKSQIVFGLRHSPVGGNRMLAAAIDRAALYDRALSPGEVAASAGVFTDAISEQELLAQLTESVKADRTRLKFESDHLRKQLARASEDRVYAVAPKNPEATHLLLRGNPATPAEEVFGGGISAISHRPSDIGRMKETPELSLPKEATDAERRKGLASWIADRRNPLFARVIVNRLWHYHFGVGIVDSPSDFGFNGGRPSHPELLDWLATELMDHDWSLKHLHRLMVTSATYRQSSRPQFEATKKDAGNRLLWRKSPQRLDAETLRDAVLRVAGELNPTVGGPGYHDFTTFVFNSQFYDIIDPVGNSFYRRSLYRTWVRSGRNPFLEVLDCPDPSTKTPRRAVTTTPLQALSLLNNSFMLRMSQRLAETERQNTTSVSSQDVSRMVERVLGRKPSELEIAELRTFATQHGLPTLARVLFNSNEFLYID
ncbi:MAG: DUF1553 domain-containing protein [Planctomycetes bacterium]|nr:DUF1553 domain-containing protein [Planctomycetota bacterium]